MALAALDFAQPKGIHSERRPVDGGALAPGAFRPCGGNVEPAISRPRARTVPQMPVSARARSLSPNSNRADCACSTAERTSSGRTHCMKKAGTVWITCPLHPGLKQATVVSIAGLL